MIDVLLVSERTVVTANGDSEPLDLNSAETRIFLLTLSITSVVEQESIEVSVFTSEDGSKWESKPIAALPQKFYVGEYPLLVDLTAVPSARFLRAHWDVSRWGRGPTTPHFEIGVRIREVPREMLQEAAERTAAGSR
jgi:hypothetical protein